LKSQVTVPAHFVDGKWVEDMRIEHVWDAVRENDPENKQVSVVPLSAMGARCDRIGARD
jgi:hypothetical protein